MLAEKVLGAMGASSMSVGAMGLLAQVGGAPSQLAEHLPLVLWCGGAVVVMMAGVIAILKMYTAYQKNIESAVARGMRVALLEHVEKYHRNSEPE